MTYEKVYEQRKIRGFSLGIQGTSTRQSFRALQQRRGLVKNLCGGGARKPRPLRPDAVRRADLLLRLLHGVEYTRVVVRNTTL